MKHLKIYSKAHIWPYMALREGETKFGEKVQFVKSLELLAKSSAQYVVFGIPEDIGVRANHGKPGTSTAWKAFLGSFLNIQNNAYNQPENCILLGEIDCEKIMGKAAEIPNSDEGYHEKLGALVRQLDQWVSDTMTHILAAGKTPVVIGGGHNNAYGNIKGSSTALKRPINVLNIDAHTDLRKTEHRHSGNGFSYAITEKFLKKYSVFGLHKNYTSASIFAEIDASEDLQATLFEDLMPLSCAEKTEEIKKATAFLGADFGLEIDCDAISGFPSSAITPSGFTLDEIRAFLLVLKKNKPHYLHLCEASAKTEPTVGKALAYLVSDFMRS